MLVCGTRWKEKAGGGRPPKNIVQELVLSECRQQEKAGEEATERPVSEAWTQPRGKVGRGTESKAAVITGQVRTVLERELRGVGGGGRGEGG